MTFLLRIVLAAALVLVAPAFAQAPKKAVASPALQKEFDGFIGKFRAALKVNDSAAVRRRVRTEMTAVGTAARSVSLWAHDPLKTGLLG